MTIKQFKLTNDDEIICEVVQWDDPNDSGMVIRAAMRIVLIEDFKRGIRFATWCGFTNEGLIRKYGPDGSDYYQMRVIY